MLLYHPNCIVDVDDCSHQRVACPRPSRKSCVRGGKPLSIEAARTPTKQPVTIRSAPDTRRLSCQDMASVRNARNILAASLAFIHFNVCTGRTLGESASPPGLFAVVSVRERERERWVVQQLEGDSTCDVRTQSEIEKIELNELQETCRTLSLAFVCHQLDSIIPKETNVELLQTALAVAPSQVVTCFAKQAS